MNLLEKIIKHPEEVTATAIDALVAQLKDDPALLTPQKLKETFFRIYDLNEESPLGEADEGVLGFFNTKSNKKRRKKVKKRLRKAFQRLRDHEPFIRIYAEGDSWFQHPLIKEVVDHLNRDFKKTGHVILDSAMGGDWLLNYLHGNKYLEEISLYNPDIMMFSGGGNDLVGKLKIAHLIASEGCFHEDLKQGLQNGVSRDQVLSKHPVISRFIQPDSDEYDPDRLFRGFQHLTSDFYSAMWFLELAYKYMVFNIRKKYKTQKIITQGYDYVIPSFKRAPIFRLRRFILNWGMDNGGWLYDAFALRNIHDKQTQQDVMYTFIYCYNEMLIRLAHHPVYGKNVYHIDARGTAVKASDWFDEMHLSPACYKQMAVAFHKCITDTSTEKKVYKVRRKTE